MQQLTSVKTLSGETVAAYTYDEIGLRLTKTVGDTTHEYFYNNEALGLEVLKKNDEVIQYSSYEWDGYTPLGMIVKEKDTTGNFQTKAYQFITNQRGDVLSIRDQDDKEVGSYSYDTYGNILSAEGDVAKDNPIRYAGYYYDEETKNYYLQARYYNPENGAFLELDSHPGDDDEPISQNGYTYANNNPVKNVDPNGNDAMWITAPHGANGHGHTSLLIKYKKHWYYFFYGTKKDGMFNAPSKVVLKRIKLPKSIKSINNMMGYGHDYLYSTYIKGDFSKSYKYAKKVKKDKPKYWVNRRNCMQMSIDVLMKSAKGNFTMDQSLTLLNLRDKIRPNSVRKPIAELFGNKKYKH